MAQAFGNDDTFAAFEQKIALLGLKQNLTFEHDEGLVFVLVRVPAFKFALQLDQTNPESTHLCQIARCISLCKLVSDLLDRKKVNFHQHSPENKWSGFSGFFRIESLILSNPGHPDAFPLHRLSAAHHPLHALQLG